MLGLIGGASQVNPTAAAYAAYRKRPRKPASPPSPVLDYGVVFRFQVFLDGVHTGDWSACNGLKVEFKPDQLRSGGAYTSARWMPGEVSYSRITLRRAINAEGSTKVQEWLKTKAWQWMRESYHPEDAGSTATIVLYDADNEAVMRWTLRGVRPWSWSGPDLDAGAGKIALETLELVHRGFLVDVLKGPQNKFRGRDDEPKAEYLSIHQDGAPGEKITFPLNPDSVVFSFSAAGLSGLKQKPADSADSGGGGFDPDDTPAGIRTYAVSGLNLFEERTGKRRDVKTQAELLLGWAKAKAKGTEPVAEIKVLVSWGSFLKDEAMKITDVQITFARFLANGEPIRAKVTTLKLEQWPTPAVEGNKNPTSGGVAGRRTHRLTQGESLASLSQHYYGNGLRWRMIAEANGIDDPARLRPGTLVYLPASAEVSGGSGG